MSVHAADSLAKLIFVDTPAEASMQISLPSLRTVKELFFLLLDLFIRGLLLLFASVSEGGIAVHAITSRQFETLAAKLRVAGIVCQRTVIDDPRITVAAANVDALMRAPPNLPLERYRLEARTRGRVYTMWFSIVHNLRPGDQRCGESVHPR